MRVETRPFCIVNRTPTLSHCEVREEVRDRTLGGRKGEGWIKTSQNLLFIKNKTINLTRRDTNLEIILILPGSSGSGWILSVW